MEYQSISSKARNKLKNLRNKLFHGKQFNNKGYFITKVNTKVTTSLKNIFVHVINTHTVVKVLLAAGDIYSLLVKLRKK